MFLCLEWNTLSRTLQCAPIQTDDFPIKAALSYLILFAVLLHSCVCLFYQKMDYHCSAALCGRFKSKCGMTLDSGMTFIAVCVQFTVFEVMFIMLFIMYKFIEKTHVSQITSIRIKGETCKQIDSCRLGRQRQRDTKSTLAFCLSVWVMRSLYLHVRAGFVRSGSR